MHRIENPLVVPPILSSDDILMPDDTASQTVTLEIESINPGIRVDYQPFIPSVIEMIPEEAPQSMLCQLILTNLPNHMMRVLCKRKLSLGLFVYRILDMMDTLATQ